MVEMAYTKGERSILKLNDVEKLLLLEISNDLIDSASKFVDYISSEYQIPKSTVWYNLKKLKLLEIIDFASKEEIGKPLRLTAIGKKAIYSMSSPEMNASSTVSSPALRRIMLEGVIYNKNF